MEEEQSPGRRLLQAAATLAYLGAVCWTMASGHTRQRLAMRASLAVGRLLDVAARWTGRSGMRAELAAGRERPEHYDLPLAFSDARDACARAYERFRSGGAL